MRRISGVMAQSSPYEVVLSDEQRRGLERRAVVDSGSKRDVVRARAILLAAVGFSNTEIAERVGRSRPVLSTWRRRFCEEGVQGLEERPRPGSAAAFFPSARVAEVKALACELPVERGVSLSRWSSAVLAREAITRGIVATVAAITVWRWLREGAIRPWSYRSWMFPREAKFAEKAGPGPVRGPVGGAAAGARRCRGVRMRGRRSGPARARIPVNLPRLAGKASWSSTSISARGCALLLGRVGCAPSQAV